ncbi:MAG: PBECR4 domain-containing protein, partial [Lactobacillus crispatus]|nr:PBECR4 domain-containing protein [Lactobacillus crispatus]MCT7699077.1 PBECR4 domain-containing protein [Lactobacillus crispatus]
MINDMYIDNINNFTKFYNEKLANKTIDYVFKDNHNLSLLSVNFGKENFPHLLGLRFDRRKPNQVLSDILNNKIPNAVLLKNDRTTFLKMQALNSAPKLLQTDSFILKNLSKIESIHKLNLDSSIESSDKNLMVLLRDSEKDGIIPASLMNLNSGDLKCQLMDIPENTILGIFQESKNQIEYLDENDKRRKIKLSRGAGAIAINHEYIKTPLDAMSLAMVVNKKLTLSTKTERQKKLTVKVDSKARDIAMRRLRDQGLER